MAESSLCEQRRVGQDLHDGLYQVLAAIAMLAEVLRGRLAQSNASDSDVASTISGHARQAIEQARMLAHGLALVDLEINGLTHALKEMADHTTTLLQVECEFHCDEPVLIQDPAQASHLYRVAQEAINNAIKHGNPGRIDLALSNRKGNVELRIADDGVGFQPESNGGSGMGLHTMKYRASIIGAQFEIRSVSPRGTEVICTFTPDQSPLASTGLTSSASAKTYSWEMLPRERFHRCLSPAPAGRGAEGFPFEPAGETDEGGTGGKRGCLDPLPNRFAEKIESKFSVARRERGSAAGCVTEEQRRHRGFWPILIRAPSEASKSPPQKITFFGKDFWQGVYGGSSRSYAR